MTAKSRLRSLPEPDMSFRFIEDHCYVYTIWLDLRRAQGLPGRLSAWRECRQSASATATKAHFLVYRS